MKLLAVILIVAVSVSSVLPFTGDALECGSEYAKIGNYCLLRGEKILGCPADEGSKQGDRCYVDNNHCSLGSSDHSAKGEDLTDHECSNGLTYNRDSNVCESVVDHGVAEHRCLNGLVKKDNTCRWVFEKFNVCSDPPPNPQVNCLLRRHKVDKVWGCQPNYERINSNGEETCVFTGVETAFCPKDTTLDSEDQCLTDFWDEKSSSFSCNRGTLNNGRCIEARQETARHFCQLKSDSSASAAVTACFGGTVEGSRCSITESVPRISTCAAGFIEISSTCVLHSKAKEYGIV